MLEPLCDGTRYVEVSIHTRPERRAMRFPRQRHGRGCEVSIHTRPERRAMLFPYLHHRELKLFQSTPAPKGGRCPEGSAIEWWAMCFNPHPPRKAGDAGARVQLYSVTDVSIHTRPERRAMHASTNITINATTFQSTPAPKGGRCLYDLASGDIINVSIHTRPERRAMLHWYPPPLESPAVSIHTRPERRAMQHSCKIMIFKAFQVV